MSTRKLTRWWSQVSMRHIAFCSMRFSGMLIRLLGKEIPLPGDLDTRIDTSKWKHTVCNKGSLCVEKIKLQALYTCKPPRAQKLLFLFYSQIEKRLLNLIYFSLLKKKLQDSVSLISLHMQPLQLKWVSSE